MAWNDGVLEMEALRGDFLIDLKETVPPALLLGRDFFYVK